MLGETVLACNGDSLSSSSSSAFFFSAPASPTHFLLSSSPLHSAHSSIATSHLEQADFEFGLVARSMSTAEDLFFNGQIRPGFVSTDQTPLSYPEPVHRRTRSVSPTRSPLSLWRDQRKASAASLKMKPESEVELNPNMASETARSQHELESVSASTSRSSSSNSSSSSSSNANSRRWGFIKDLLSLQRSKSEGGLLATQGAGSRLAPQTQSQRQRSSICTNGSGRMAHSSSFGPGLYKERHRRPEMDSVKEMRRRMTFLPYKQQWFLFGCLGFSSSRLTTNAGIATVSARHS
ncbi:hypothetical protein LUZ61_000059 [Rhynchospora tenuis]|uniref:Uncharacterized protein n=1 Tax=Rhynchospora tenuis TaxID=198213 RepID=A0AAD5ZE30_9POAL|nr:hypothetical protein LUZ61_021016 [Rhynchospora tenuis]KAJ3696354.1 hypothetical protein LUZ61_000059 [Rhynchospora tenuis]